MIFNEYLLTLNIDSRCNVITPPIRTCYILIRRDLLVSTNIKNLYIPVHIEKIHQINNSIFFIEIITLVVKQCF